MLVLEAGGLGVGRHGGRSGGHIDEKIAGNRRRCIRRIGFSDSNFEVLLNNGHRFPQIFTDKKTVL
jgi:hypothetical protein